MKIIRWAITFVLLLCISRVATGDPAPATAPGSAVERDLAEYRAKYPTVLTKHGPSPKIWQGHEIVKRPDDVSEVTYDSGSLKLKAWISGVPKDGVLHPAVVYCHGGFWFGMEDWQAVRPFIDAGYVVMTPMLRGENGNPGEFSYFFGETDDVNAAGRYLAQVPGVDPKRLFVSGHSAGGSVAALSVMMKDTTFVLSAPIGASLDTRSAGKWTDERSKALVVFDWTNIHETEARTALLFTAGLRTPIRLFQGNQDGNGIIQKNFLLLAHHFKKFASLETVPGDHMQSQTNAIPRVIAWFSDFAPGRHATVDLPTGWKPTTFPMAQIKPLVSAIHVSAKAYCMVFAERRDRFSTEATTSTYAELLKISTGRASQLDKRQEGEITAARFDGIPCVYYDTTGVLNQLNLHYRKFFVQTDHYFVQIICWSTEDDFAAATETMSQFVAKAHEVVD